MARAVVASSVSEKGDNDLKRIAICVRQQTTPEAEPAENKQKFEAPSGSKVQ